MIKTKTSKLKSAVDKAALKRSALVRGILAYPTLVTPEAYQDGKEPKYGTLLIFDPESTTGKNLIELVADHAEALTGSRELPGNYHDPIRDGDEEKGNGELVFKHPAFRGKAVVRLKSSFQPKCFYGPNKTPIAASEIGGGDEALVSVTAYSFSNLSKGVACSLGSVLLIGKTEHTIERGAGSAADFDSVDLSGIEFRTADAAESVE